MSALVALVVAVALAAEGAPTVPALAAPNLPTPVVHGLAEGGEAWVLPRAGVPLTRIEVSLLRGHLEAPDPVALRLAAALLQGGTREHPRGAWAAAVRDLGADVELGVGALRAWADVEVVRGEEAAAVALVAEAVRAPTLRSRDIRRLRRTWRDSARGGWQSGLRVAEGATILAIYPADHPRGRIDTARDYARVTPRRVRAAWAWLVDTAPLRVIVAGDPDVPVVLAAVDEAWRGRSPGPPAAPPPPPPPAGPRVILVDHPGADQAQIRASLPAPGEFAPEAAGALLVAEVLGGHFTSRLNARLREDLGIAYGAWSRLEQAPAHGRLVLETAVAPADVAVALSEVNDALFGMIAFPPDDAEVERARRALLLEGARSLDRIGDLTWHYGRAQVGGQPADAPARLLADIAAYPASDVPDAARALLDSDDVVWIVLADRFAVERVLDEAGWTPDTLWSGRDVVAGAVRGRAGSE